MSDMLNQKHVLAKLRAELEGREGRICRKYGKFRHLARKCRSEKGQKKKTIAVNRFEVLGSRVIQCGVREVRRQEIVREVVRCFGCEEEGHKKWECPKRKEKKREEAPPPQEIWEKVKKYSGARVLPLRGVAMCMEG